MQRLFSSGTLHNGFAHIQFPSDLITDLKAFPPWTKHEQLTELRFKLLVAQETHPEWWHLKKRVAVALQECFPEAVSKVNGPKLTHTSYLQEKVYSAPLRRGDDKVLQQSFHGFFQCLVPPHTRWGCQARLHRTPWSLTRLQVHLYTCLPSGVQQCNPILQIGSFAPPSNRRCLVKYNGSINSWSVSSCRGENKCFLNVW